MMIADNHGAMHGHTHTGLRPASAFGGLPAATDNYPQLQFGELYSTVGIIGMRLTERARALRGSPVVIRGYMAPPLVEQGRHFMLTRAPVHSCPFCDDGARWPHDALPAFLELDSHFTDPTQPIDVIGELEILSPDEPRWNGLRLVRLVNATWQSVGAAQL